MTFNPLQIALRPLFKKAQEEDALFAIEVEEKSAREDKRKSFDECCDYVLGEAYKYAKEHQCDNVGLAFADETMVISMMKHYWDEDDIEITKFGDAKVKVETTEQTPKDEPVATPVAPTAKKGKAKQSKPIVVAKKTEATEDEEYTQGTFDFS